MFPSLINQKGQSELGLTLNMMVSTYAGIPKRSGYKEGDRLECMMVSPRELIFDCFCNLYCCDLGNRVIRYVDVNGQTHLLCGSPGVVGSKTGIKSQALLSAPSSLCLNASESALYVTDIDDQTIRKVDLSSGYVSLVCGTSQKRGCSNTVDDVTFDWPRGIVVDKEERIYVCDGENRVIRKIENQSITNFCGCPSMNECRDGKGPDACFYWPKFMTMDFHQRNIYLTDNNCIRKIDLTSAQVTTLCGKFDEEGDQDGFASNARFNAPYGLTIDRKGILIVADSGNHCVRMINTLTGRVRTLTGGPDEWFQDGDRLNAKFNAPYSVTLHPISGAIFVSDEENHVIRKITGIGLQGRYWDQKEIFSNLMRITRILLSRSANNANVNRVCDIRRRTLLTVILDTMRNPFFEATAFDEFLIYFQNRSTLKNRKADLLKLFGKLVKEALTARYSKAPEEVLQMATTDTSLTLTSCNKRQKMQ